MDDIKIFDSTLRDGSHAIGHALTESNVRDYCRAIDGSGVHVVIVGHGNGLGASSLQVGISATPDAVLLKAAREELKRTKLGVLIFPGFGTIDDDLKPALALRTDLILVAAHCTEADLTAQYISYAKAQKKEVYGMLMMYHMTTADRLLAEAKKMEGYGAQGILLMDSAGASTPALVKETVTHLVSNLSIPVGFHAHNNLGMAVAHTWLALEAGAKIVDGTVKGFGAGAGNCALEVLTALLQKMGYKTPTDLYKLMDAGEELKRSVMKKPQEISTLSIASALAGVFSGFARQAKRAAEMYDVDPRDIFKVLGERRIIVGQEDMVFEIAMELAKLRKGQKK